MTTKNFKQTCEFLDKIGVDYRARDESFKGFYLPFTPEEWWEICTCDGEHYIGPCCGQTGVIQDYMNSIFREGGWITWNNLEWMAEAFIRHDGDSSYFHLDAYTKAGYSIFEEDNYPSASNDPWGFLSFLYHTVKDHCKGDVPRTPRSHISDVEEAFSLMHKSMFSFMWDCTVNRDRNNKEIDASRAIRVGRMLPALKILNEKISEFDPSPVEGFAIVDLEQENPDRQIARGVHGLCVYETQEEADKLLDEWKFNSFGIRKVKISSREGVEFLTENLRKE